MSRKLLVTVLFSVTTELSILAAGAAPVPRFDSNADGGVVPVLESAPVLSVLAFSGVPVGEDGAVVLERSSETGLFDVELEQWPSDRAPYVVVSRGDGSAERFGPGEQVRGRRWRVSGVSLPRGPSRSEPEFQAWAVRWRENAPAQRILATGWLHEDSIEAVSESVTIRPARRTLVAATGQRLAVATIDGRTVGSEEVMVVDNHVTLAGTAEASKSNCNGTGRDCVYAWIQCDASDEGVLVGPASYLSDKETWRLERVFVAGPAPHSKSACTITPVQTPTPLAIGRQLRRQVERHNPLLRGAPIEVQVSAAETVPLVSQTNPTITSLTTTVQGRQAIDPKRNFVARGRLILAQGTIDTLPRGGELYVRFTGERLPDGVLMGPAIQRGEEWDLPLQPLPQELATGLTIVLQAVVFAHSPLSGRARSDAARVAMGASPPVLLSVPQEPSSEVLLTVTRLGGSKVGGATVEFLGEPVASVRGSLEGGAPGEVPYVHIAVGSPAEGYRVVRSVAPSDGAWSADLTGLESGDQIIAIASTSTPADRAYSAGELASLSLSPISVVALAKPVDAVGLRKFGLLVAAAVVGALGIWWRRRRHGAMNPEAVPGDRSGSCSASGQGALSPIRRAAWARGGAVVHALSLVTALTVAVLLGVAMVLYLPIYSRVLRHVFHLPASVADSLAIVLVTFTALNGVNVHLAAENFKGLLRAVAVTFFLGASLIIACLQAFLYYTYYSSRGEFAPAVAIAVVVFFLAIGEAVAVFFVMKLTNEGVVNLAKGARA